MKASLSLIKQHIFYTVVLFSLNNLLHGAEWDLAKVPQPEVEKILKLRLSGTQMYEIKDPFDKNPHGRALISFEKKGFIDPVIVQKRIETRYHSDSNRFIKTIVETTYEGTYPYKFLNENYEISEALDGKPYEFYRSGKIQKDGDRWMRHQKIQKRENSQTLNFTPMSLADQLLPAAASAYFDMQSGDQFPSKAEDLKVEVPVQKAVRYQAHIGQDTDATWKYEKDFSISSDYEFNDEKLRSFSYHNGIPVGFREKNDFVIHDNWHLKDSKSKLTAENFEASLREDVFKPIRERDRKTEEWRNKEYPGEILISVPQSFPDGIYDDILSFSLMNRKTQSDYRSDNDLISSSYTDMERVRVGDKDFVSETEHDVSLTSHKGTYYLASTNTRSLYEPKFPYKFVSMTSTMSLRHPEKNTIEEVVTTTIEQKGEKWIKNSKQQSDGKEESEDLKWDETPRLKNNMAFRAWLRSAERKVGDILQVELMSTPDGTLDFRTFTITDIKTETVNGVTKPISYKVKVEMDDGTVGTAEVSANVDNVEFHFDSMTANIKDADNSKSLTELSAEKAKVLTQTQLVQDAMILEKGFHDGKVTFDVKMPEGKKLIDGPDQIAHLLNKDQNLYRVTLGSEINPKYNTEKILTRPEDSDIPESWLKEVKAKFKKDMKQLDQAMIAVEFVKDQITYHRDGTLKTLKEACNSKKGDCSEFSLIAAAMLRRLGIPAHTTGGFVHPLSVDRGAHAQVEAFVDGKWIAIEATGKGAFLSSHDATGVFLKTENNEDDDYAQPYDSIEITKEVKSAPEAKAGKPTVNHADEVEMDD